MSNNKHNELSEDQILLTIKITGAIGRHKYKKKNANINKKLRRMCRDGKIKMIKNSRDFAYYGLPGIK